MTSMVLFEKCLYVYPSVKIYLYVSLCICRSVELKVKVLLESHSEHRPSLHVYLTAFASTKLYCIVTEAMDCLKVSIYSSAVTQS